MPKCTGSFTGNIELFHDSPNFTAAYKRPGDAYVAACFNPYKFRTA